MTTPVNPHPAVRPELDTETVSGGSCAGPTLPSRSGPSRAPVRLAAAMRSCEFIQARSGSRLDDSALGNTAVAQECAHPADCERLGDCAQPEACGRPGDPAWVDDGARAERAADAGSAVGDRADAADRVSDGGTWQGDHDPARPDGAVQAAATIRSGWSAGVGGTVLDQRAVVCADQAPPFTADPADCVVRVDEPGELIAGVPAMIGFPPERSLVVLVLRAVLDREAGAIIDAVMRFDLDQDGGRNRLRAATVAQCVAQICVHDEVAEVLAVVVDDRAVEPAEWQEEFGERCGVTRFDALISALGRRLAVHDVGLAGAWAVRAIEAEQDWWSLIGPDRRGALPDPATSPVAVSHVLDGRQIHGSREELTALVAADTEVRDQVAALLDSALTVARDRYARAVRRGDPNAYSRQALEYVLWQIANVESGVELMAPELAELAAALRDRAVRDTMFALAVGEHAEAAEGLWSVLTRALTGRDRAEAASLLGYSAYTRGDGPLAGIALEAALSADPGHPLATLLETSLSLGMRPEQLRRLARSGYHTAEDLGIDLGEPIM